MEHLRVAPLRNFNKENNTRRCNCCNKWKDLSEFSTRVTMPSPTTRDVGKQVPTLYYREQCKECSLKTVKVDKYASKEARRERHKKDPRKVMLMHARSRAKKEKLPFNIDYADIIIPDICPLLEIPIVVGVKNAHANSPTIDKIIPSKGYVKGNVQVISYKANTVKNDLTIQELEKLVSNFRGVLLKPGELRE